MSFLSAAFLLALPLVAVPVAIHLYRGRQRDVVMWGAMQFLLESPLQLKRKKKVEHWLLLLLRMAILGVLAFLLARPLFVDGKYNPLSSNVATDIAVVIDRSVSTGRANGTSTVFAQSVDLIQDVGVFRWFRRELAHGIELPQR